LSHLKNTQFKMAEIDTEIDIMETYVDSCVELLNRGELSASRASKAKLQASEINWRMMDLGVQLHGGAGYMQEYPICQLFLDSRINRIWAGTSEVMKLIIGREIFSDEYTSRINQ
jgi:acyl-CoA dehydrogenase